MKPNCSINIASSSAAVDQLGSQIDAQFLIHASAQAVITGTSTGTLNLQGSNDPQGSLAVGSTGQSVAVNWNNISGATVAIAGAGSYIIPKVDVCYRWIRLSYVHNNAAAGTVIATLNTHGV